MAIWQYDMFLVGEENTLPLPKDDGWELPQLLAASTLNAQRTLVGSMGNPWLMMEDWIVFGSEVGTRVDLLFDSDKVEILIRLDASATERELNAVCSFVGELNGRLFDPATRTLLQPDRTTLASALATSRAAAFSQSPRSYLSGQSRG
ncbi:hypothetical protein [Janthinobacterium sp. 78]|jgi:hypothetical protein|uniref:hypothetical protein n=1 Tax=Janthinobacterium sp. 78 TaxID=2135631 RepID=UPI00105787D9|nr:hypothetical protein [Janthinobacterium sp. 78]